MSFAHAGGRVDDEMNEVGNKEPVYTTEGELAALSSTMWVTKGYSAVRR